MLSDLHLIWKPCWREMVAAVSAYQLVTDTLAERGIPFTSEKSEYAGNATELAKAAVENGAKKDCRARRRRKPSARWQSR